MYIKLCDMDCIDNFFNDYFGMKMSEPFKSLDKWNQGIELPECDKYGTPKEKMPNCPICKEDELGMIIFETNQYTRR